MPKLKPSDQEERNRIVRACIAGNQERQGIDDAGLAKCLGVVPDTVRNKKKRPETFTLRELQTVSRALKFSPIQAASIVLGRDLTTSEIRDFVLGR